MAIRGRPPKSEETRRTAHALTHEYLDVIDKPYEGTKPRLYLPDYLTPVVEGSKKIPPALTRKWWKTVSAMPHCVLWVESDWQFALDTALIHAKFVLGDERLGTELRNRERAMGMTLESRRNLRIRYIPEVVEEEAEGAAPSAIEDYQRRLGRKS